MTWGATLQEERNAMPQQTRDYGVKLCGREFIRAVIFTCGGSRWRRSLDQDQDQETLQSSPFLLSSFQNPSDRTGESIWTQINKEPTFLSSSSSSSSSPSLSELLQAMGEQVESGRVEPDQSEELLRDEGFRTWLDGLLPSGRFRKMNFSLSSPDRKKRNFSLGLAGMCCNQGCTKNDIGRLC
ncbi:hypothetical protein NFI96_000894 [Prochilodus magdalenae]|nr:hypothetical protein NFI96_000894 [Prochilodus magdalenae]